MTIKTSIQIFIEFSILYFLDLIFFRGFLQIMSWRKRSHVWAPTPQGMLSFVKSKTYNRKSLNNTIKNILIKYIKCFNYSNHCPTVYNFN